MINEEQIKTHKCGGEGEWCVKGGNGKVNLQVRAKWVSGIVQ